MTKTALGAALLCSLVGCSTNQSSAPPSDVITTTMPSGGVYKGSLKGTTTDATLLTLFDGTAYLFYGSATGADLAGVAVATNGAQTSDGRFTSNTALDYRVGTAPAKPVAFMANFAHAPSVSGAVVGKDGSPDLDYNVAAAAMLDVAPSQNNAGGLYSGRAMSLGGVTGTRVTVAGDGYLAGTTAAGCIFKGTVNPHPGINAYDVSVTFGPAPCPLPDATVKGNGVLDGPRLLVALPSADHTNVFLFDGRK